MGSLASCVTVAYLFDAQLRGVDELGHGGFVHGLLGLVQRPEPADDFDVVSHDEN